MFRTGVSMASNTDDTTANSSLGLSLADLGWRRMAFTIVVLIPLVLYLGVFGFWRNQVLLVTSWFGGFGLLEPVFYDIAHRLHEFAAAMMLWPLVVGLLAQFRAPKRHVSGILMALWSVLSVLLGIALTGGWELTPIVAFLGVPTLVATLLHPAGRELLSAFSPARLDTLTLALVVIAALPLLAMAANQVGLQTGAIELAHDHAAAGHDAEVHQAHIDHHHFMFVSAFIISAIGVGLLTSFRPPGWRLSAWLVGAMVGVFGLAGILAPSAASNPGVLWNLGAVVWAVGFVVVAERTDEPDRSGTTAAQAG